MQEIDRINITDQLLLVLLKTHRYFIHVIDVIRSNIVRNVNVSRMIGYHIIRKENLIAIGYREPVRDYYVW